MIGPTETGDMSAERIYTLNRFLREKFGKKMIKLSLDGGFTCPNRDGTKGTGGCLFCSETGSGEFSSTIEDQIRLLSKKWPDAGWIAYFQNHTNTYAPVSELQKKYEAALSHPGVEGLAVATRPDCLPPDVLALLEKIGRKTFLWVELGLQTAQEKTAALINRCYPLSEYDRAMQNLRALGIPVVTHLILGLPGETRQDMIDSVCCVCESGTWGIKLHLLNVVRGSRLAQEYPDYVPFSSMKEYIDLVCDLIEIIPENIVIHRLTADAPRRILIAPEWSFRKRSILNGINAELKRRGTWQGVGL